MKESQVLKQSMKEKRWNFYLYGFFLILCVWMATKIPLMKKMDVDLADRFYQTGYSVSENRIVILAIDEETLSHLGHVGTWNRERYATVLSHLYDIDGGPKVVGIDVEFSGPYNGDEKDPGDQLLADTVGSLPNIVLANHLVQKNHQTAWSDYLSVLDQAVEEGQGSFGYTNLFLDRLDPDDQDDIVRHVIYRYGGNYPSFALQVARAYDASNLQINASDLDTASYLRFAGKAETAPEHYGTSFEKVSFWSVYNGDITPARFRDKIVLIGAYEAGLGDEYPTAIDHAGRMAGVEIQANMINALLDSEYPALRELPDLLQMGSLLLLLIFLLLLLARTNLYGASFFWCGSLLLFLPVMRLLQDRGWMLHPMWIPAGMSLIMLYGVLYHALEARRQRTELRMQFGRYVDDMILEQILLESSRGKGIREVGERREAAVMFVDICGFTALSEQKEPEDIVQLLNQYFGIVTDVAAVYHGTIDKFIGDAAMLIWNVPREQVDYPLLALRAAEEIIRRVEREKNLPIQIAIGIDSGPCVVGNIGSDRRMDYTVIGDPVNTASRLEGLKLPGQDRKNQIYVSDTFYRSLGERVKAESLGSCQVRGKEQGVTVYQILKEEVCNEE